jgi:hypothetical protein
MSQQQMTPIKGDPFGHGVGGYVATPDDDSTFTEIAFDVAMTPCLTIAPEQEPRIDHWVVSRRTTLDPRPRKEVFPFNHIGVIPPRLSGGEYRALLELVETKQAQCRAGGDGGGAIAFEQIASKLKAAIATEDGREGA